MVVDIIYVCADICEHEFDVEVEIGMLGSHVNYTISNVFAHEHVTVYLQCRG